MILTTFIFAVQDGLSRILAAEYNIYLVVMIRYWFFAAFVVVLSSRSRGIRKTARSARLKLQMFRGALLAVEICVTVAAFVALGLVETHAIFACYPLIIAALSGPILGESVGWRRWVAICVGLIGVLIILRPSSGVFHPNAIVPVIAAIMFALYGLLTRFVARFDAADTSFFWTGIAGAIVMTGVGLFHLEPMSSTHATLMATLCVTGVIGHFLLIKCYEIAEASAVQPFAFFQLVFASLIGVLVFGETLRTNVAIGSVIVIAAGIFTVMRARRGAQQDADQSGETA